MFYWIIAKSAKNMWEQRVEFLYFSDLFGNESFLEEKNMEHFDFSS